MRTTTTLIILGFSLCGCVTPQAIQQPTHAIDFAQFKTVSYAVHDNQQTEYGSSDEDRKYGKDTISLLGSMLGAKLTSQGYQVVDASMPHDLAIDVIVTEVKPGSGAARFWVGFGAGRADTEFDASFTDAHGVILTSFHGGRSFTGMEMNVSPFSGRSEISALAATRSVQQIHEFMHAGGIIAAKR